MVIQKQFTKFVKQSKNIDGETAYDTQSMFVLTVLEKIKKTGL